MPDPGQLSPLVHQATGVTAVRGEGMYIEDPSGRRYLDFTAGIGVTSTGHCHPRVVEAAQQQVATLIHGQYTTVLHPRIVELSERLGEVTPDAIDTFFYTSAGTEAVEAALRLARHATGRPNVIVFHGSFHGRTMGALSMTSSRTVLRAGLQPMMGGVTVAPFPYAYRYGWSEEETVRFCLRELDHVLASLSAPDETAAMFIEPVLGEGGYVPVPDEFLRGLRERCDRHGILLVMDEIQSGMGRTGRFWGHQHADVEPDIIITAKGLASGFPLSAIGAPADLMASGRPGSQGGTYGGNAVSCAAAIATLDVIQSEGLIENAAKQGAHAMERLHALADGQPRLADVRGRGLMVGIEFRDEDGEPDGDLARRVLEAAVERGLLLLTCGTYGQIVRMIPALIVNGEQVDEAIDVFGEAVEAAVSA